MSCDLYGKDQYERSGYLAPCQKPSRESARVALRNACEDRPCLPHGNNASFGYKGSKPYPNPRTVLVIRGDNEGMVGKFAGKTRKCPATGTYPIERCEILISATNQMPFCYKADKWKEYTPCWVDCEDIDWYDKVVEEEMLFHCEDARARSAHILLLNMYDMYELIEFKRLWTTPDDSLPEKMMALIKKYLRKEEEPGTNEWYWRQAQILLTESPDFFWAFSIEEETVSKMGDAFKKTVLHILHTKQRAEDEEREEGQKQDLHRTAILAAHHLKLALTMLVEFEDAQNVRMMMPDPDDDGNFERALPHRAKMVLEDMIGGLTQVKEATPAELSDMVKAGTRVFSRTECAGCGDEVGGGQCDYCFTGVGNKRRRPVFGM